MELFVFSCLGKFGVLKGGKMRDNREKNDIVTKNFETFPDVAADIINALLHNGRKIVTKENLMPAPTESIYIDRKNILRNQLEDVAKYEVVEGQTKAQYMIANQTAPDAKIVLRKAGYTGGGYREQYEGKVTDTYPIIEMILYWGREHWEKRPGIYELCCEKVPEDLRKYVDDMKVHIWEMRYLPKEVREKFCSDMRIVLDYLAEGNAFRSNQKVVHKAALIRMINVLSGEDDSAEEADILKEMNIREEDEITMCELFEQYVRMGKRKGREEGREEERQSGIKALVITCMELGADYNTTAEKLRARFQLSDEGVTKNMNLYWN